MGVNHEPSIDANAFWEILPQQLKQCVFPCLASRKVVSMFCGKFVKVDIEFG